MIWVRKKTGTPIARINSVDEANNFLQKHTMFAVGLFDKFEVCASVWFLLLNNSDKSLIANILVHQTDHSWLTG